MVPEALDEGALVDGLKAGDERAYRQLVEAYGGRMLTVARRFVDEGEAADAVQEAFVSAFKSIHRFDRRSQVGTWLHRILVNACLMRLRYRKSRPEESLEPLLPAFLEDGHRVDPGRQWPLGPEQMLARKETRSVVREAIASLPETHRMVLLLRDLEGWTGKETGEALGITANAVKVRLHRARQALREVLDTRMQELAA